MGFDDSHTKGTFGSFLLSYHWIWFNRRTFDLGHGYTLWSVSFFTIAFYYTCSLLRFCCSKRLFITLMVQDKTVSSSIHYLLWLITCLSLYIFPFFLFRKGDNLSIHYKSKYSLYLCLLLQDQKVCVWTSDHIWCFLNLDPFNHNALFASCQFPTHFIQISGAFLELLFIPFRLRHDLHEKVDQEWNSRRDTTFRILD